MIKFVIRNYFQPIVTHMRIMLQEMENLRKTCTYLVYFRILLKKVAKTIFQPKMRKETVCYNSGFTPSNLSGLEFCPTSRRWFLPTTTKGANAKKSKVSKTKKRKSKNKSKILNKNVQKKPLKNIQADSAFPLNIQCKVSSKQFRAKPQTQRRSIQIQVATF